MKNKIIIGFVFAGVYLFLAYAAAGFGHGTYIFFSVVMPYGLGLLVYPGLFVLADYLYSNTIKLIYLTTMVVHYSLTVFFIILWWEDGFPYIIKVWSVSPFIILLPIIWFLLGQTFIWFLFFKNLNIEEIEEMK